MLFSSTTFLFLYLPLLLGLYFVGPRPVRNVILLLGSLLFYAWGEQHYVLIMLASIALNYALGIGLGRWRERPRVQNAVFILGLLVNLGMLAGFKYANFFVDNLNVGLAGLGFETMKPVRVHLPIGISFFTFQAMSYLIDIRRATVEPQRNPLHFGLYLSLFPQLIAGPIVRYRDVAEQIIQRVITRELFARGVRRFIVGLGKKLLIANVVAAGADRIFSLPAGELSLATAWFGLLCYSLQIYFDFSAYSDMAIGLGQMLGFKFLENFNYPYVARSLTEFWRRWHISLSTWYRDYLYVPLGGSRLGLRRTCLNLLIVFLLCGLWHGAGWTFVVWGLWHGLFLCAERLGLGKALERCASPLRRAYVLLIVAFGWVLFRAETLSAALAYAQALVGFGTGVHAPSYIGPFLNSEMIIVILIGLAGSTPLLPWLEERSAELLESWRQQHRPAWALEFALHGSATLGLGVILFLSALALAAGTYNPFIYFRF